MAEYEALLSGLRIAIELGVKRLDVRGDSQLVVDQVMKVSSCCNPKIEAFCNAVCPLKDKFDGFELNHVVRRYNEEVNALAKVESKWATVPPDVFARDMAQPSVDFKDPAGAGDTATEPTTEGPLPDGSEAMETDAEVSSADEAEVMEIDEAPPSQDWCNQYLD
jgi:hypothetical protein